MILINGATGNLGRPLVAEPAARAAIHQEGEKAVEIAVRERILDRPACSYAQWAAGHAAAFQN